MILQVYQKLRKQDQNLVIKETNAIYIFGRVKWLSETGCPGCRIDRADIHNWEFMSRPEFRGFCIRF